MQNKPKRMGGRAGVGNRVREMLPELQIVRPNDMHVHFREGAMLQSVVPYTARQFCRAVVMPNTKIPITTTDIAKKYKQEIMNCVPEGATFDPLMMIYLNSSSNPDDIAQGFNDGVIFGAKLYPANATTNSQYGVSDISEISDVLSVMEQIGMPLSIHGESVDKNVDIFDREAVFIEKTLTKILNDYPNLRVTMEHITTVQAVEFLKSGGDKLGATITPQHLMYNRNDMLVGGIRPHYYCSPILKREEHRLALRELATSGFKRVFLGTDSAPHSIDNKECACGCAGVFSSINALEFYAQVFDEENALDKLEDFTTNNSNSFHMLKPSDEFVQLIKSGNIVPKTISVPGKGQLLPLCSGEIIPWRADYELNQKCVQSIG
ncbi:MAG: dihydroorotase [Alphaproteobacteria bacterium]|nr:dihydroorotase [Alphaproteobacteria bacterium]